MKKILVFGTGESAFKIMHAINEKVEIVAFIDNNYAKEGQTFFGKKIILPRDIKEYTYDYILIAIIKFQKVNKQLLELKIQESKIINFFDTEILYKKNIEEVLNTSILLKINYERQLYEMTNIINNISYEIADRIREKQIIFPMVKTVDETIEELVIHKKSISRYGDGEIMLIANKDIGFQKASPALTKRLKEILISSCDNHLVGILNVFGDLSGYVDSISRYFRDYLRKYDRNFQYSLLNMEKTYYDAFITRPYFSYKDKRYAKIQFDKIKKIWEEQEIVVIEGNRTKLGVGNDLFEHVKACERIECPNENAFNSYNLILENALKIDKSKLILIALGPTATILAYDLAKEGYWAIDIGHIDIEYEWFLMGAMEKEVVKNKYTNEAYGGNSDCQENADYTEQIIVEIK